MPKNKNRQPRVWSPGARGGRSGSSSVAYRVATSDHRATQDLVQEFGIDPDILGHLTPELCRQISLQGKALERQLQMSEIAVAAFAKIGEIKAKIEALRLETVKAGFDRKREIDKHVSALELEMAKYEQSVQTLNQKHVLSLGGIQADGSSERGYLQTKFQQELQGIEERWRVKAERLGAIDVEAQEIRERRKQELAFMQGKPIGKSFASVADRWG